MVIYNNRVLAEQGLFKSTTTTFQLTETKPKPSDIFNFDHTAVETQYEEQFNHDAIRWLVL